MLILARFARQRLLTHNRNLPKQLFQPIFHQLNYYSSRKMNSYPIVLTGKEKKLRQLLLDVVDFIQKNPASESSSLSSSKNVSSDQPLQLRFTGGWVRDKILKKESDDIDVAINVMTGYDFALRLKEYLDIPGRKSKYARDEKESKTLRLHKIDANPEKSKHLETTTTNLFGLDIDLVNLRKETYTDTSRNPQMEFGTPEEDALRRDATINAIFYNIHSQTIEDFTQRGLQDIKAGIIRTPLAPRQTFIDDPLRVLRLIRFASRFNYKIDQETCDAMKLDEIKRALILKISRERVLAELEKMLKGRDARGSLELIDQLGIYDCIFVDPSDSSGFEPDINNWKHVYNALDKIISSSSSEDESTLASIIMSNPEDQYYAWFLAAFTPYADGPKVQLKKRTEPLVVKVGQEGLVLPSKILNLLKSSVENLSEIKHIAEIEEKGRDILGMSIRKWGSTWKLQTLFALLHDVLINPGKTTDHVRKYQKFLSKCQELEILDAYDFKSIIDGTSLAKALGTKPGPWMKDAMDVIMKWQLQNPDIKDSSTVIPQIEAWKKIYDQQKPQPNEKSASQPALKRQKQGELNSLLISHFLHLTIRPIFSQTQNPDLTSTGRLNINAKIDRKATPVNLSDEPPSWTGQNIWAMDLLTWVCHNIDSDIIAKEWGFLVPPILTILDSTNPPIRAKGCDLLRLLLEQTPQKLLSQTGLIPVFEDSLYTSAVYLPSFTEAKESSNLLKATIPALLTLTNTAYPDSSLERTASLLNILRKVIIAPLKHASEHVVVAEAIYDELPPLLENLGIDSVIQLKDLIPLLSTVLDEPLGLSYRPLITSAINALEALMEHAKPRVWFWRADILKGICGLWLRLSDDSSDIRTHCTQAFRQLNDAVTDSEWVEENVQTQWTEELKELQKANSNLKSLFVTIQTK